MSLDFYDIVQEGKEFGGWWRMLIGGACLLFIGYVYGSTPQVLGGCMERRAAFLIHFQ